MSSKRLLIVSASILLMGCPEPDPAMPPALDAGPMVDAAMADTAIVDSTAPDMMVLRLDSTVLPASDAALPPADSTVPDQDMAPMQDSAMDAQMGTMDAAPTDADFSPDASAEVDAEVAVDASGFDAALADGAFAPDATPVEDAEPVEDAAPAPAPDAAPEPDAAIAADVGVVERPECISDLAHFYENVWRPTIRGRCAGCHNPEGAAQDSAMVYTLQRDTLDVRRANFGEFVHISDFGWEGMPLVLAKGMGRVEHGGGAVLVPGEPAIDALYDMLDRLQDPAQDECPDWFGNVGRPLLDGLVLADDQRALRKVALHLGGRLPTADEIETVERHGAVGFELVLSRILYSPGFYDRMRELWNDILLTDMYRYGAHLIGSVSIFDYPHRDWWLSPRSWTGPLTPAMQALGNQYTVLSVGAEPVEHIVFLLENDRPFTEIIDADYIAMNPFTARFYGVDDIEFDDPWDPSEWRIGRLEGHPHAGILTSPVFLLRYPTTATNRNRARSMTFMRIFLDYDIFEAGGNDIEVGEDIHNPTMNDPQCTVCHETMDPIAGAFQNWNEDGGYTPPVNWHQNMRAPGYGDQVVPIDRQGESLKWLAERVVATPQFDRAMVHLVYTMLTGRRLEARPVVADPLFDAKMQLYEAQQAFAQRLARGFRATGHDLRYVITEVAKSPWFLAVDYQGEITPEVAAQLGAVGRGRTLTPEQLYRKILATVGHQWRTRGQPFTVPFLLGDIGLFYGGIDSDQVVERVRDPSAIFASVQQVVAGITSCEALVGEFSLMLFEPDHPRLLTPFLSGRESLFGPDGEEVPEVALAVKTNLQYLFWHLWDEDVDFDSPSFVEVYDMFVETLREGQAAIAAGESPVRLGQYCDGRHHPVTGMRLPEWDDTDPNYTIRAWQTVIFAFLVDHQFVLE